MATGWKFWGGKAKNFSWQGFVFPFTQAGLAQHLGGTQCQGWVVRVLHRVNHSIVAYCQLKSPIHLISPSSLACCSDIDPFPILVRLPNAWIVSYWFPMFLTMTLILDIRASKYATELNSFAAVSNSLVFSVWIFTLLTFWDILGIWLAVDSFGYTTCLLQSF